MKRSFCYYLKWFGVNGSAWNSNAIFCPPTMVVPLFAHVSLFCINLSLVLPRARGLIRLITFNGLSRAFILLTDVTLLPIHLNFCRQFSNELLLILDYFIAFIRCVCEKRNRVAFAVILFVVARDY